MSRKRASLFDYKQPQLTDKGREEYDRIFKQGKHEQKAFYGKSIISFSEIQEEQMKENQRIRKMCDE